jgi:hypothetical protein
MWATYATSSVRAPLDIGDLSGAHAIPGDETSIGLAKAAIFQDTMRRQTA